MTTVKFEAERLNNEILVFPAVLITVESNKSRFGICFGWLKRMLTISVDWSRKAIKVQA